MALIGGIRKHWPPNYRRGTMPTGEDTPTTAPHGTPAVWLRVIGWGLPEHARVPLQTADEACRCTEETLHGPTPRLPILDVLAIDSRAFNKPREQQPPPAPLKLRRLWMGVDGIDTTAEALRPSEGRPSGGRIVRSDCGGDWEATREQEVIRQPIDGGSRSVCGEARADDARYDGGKDCAGGSNTAIDCGKPAPALPRDLRLVAASCRGE